MRIYSFDKDDNLTLVADTASIVIDQEAQRQLVTELIKTRCPFCWTKIREGEMVCGRHEGDIHYDAENRTPRDPVE